MEKIAITISRLTVEIALIFAPITEGFFDSLHVIFDEHLKSTMGWRFAPHFWFLLLGAALANAALEQTGGQRNQWREKLLQTVGSGRIGARAKRSLNIRDKQNLNSG